MRPNYERDRVVITIRRELTAQWITYRSVIQNYIRQAIEETIW